MEFNKLAFAISALLTHVHTERVEPVVALINIVRRKNERFKNVLKRNTVWPKERRSGTGSQYDTDLIGDTGVFDDSFGRKVKPEDR